VTTVISVCIPVHNRTYDLKRTLPHLIVAANAGPPVEIVILDYNSPDDLTDYVCGVIYSDKLSSDNTITYRRYTGRDHYHMAHARNLSVMAASSEYIVIMSADICPKIGFFDAIRSEITAHNYTWMYDRVYKGVIACKRQEFIDAGGYDERFEFYSPEDHDLNLRLKRRGSKWGYLPYGMINVIKTPGEEKKKNYRLPIGLYEMNKRMRVILEENIANSCTVANEGSSWGQW
jgi:hypothetical protein